MSTPSDAPVSGSWTSSSTTNILYPTIPTVDVDPHGIYKYILIRLAKAPYERYLVRGYGWASYHDDIYQFTRQQIEQSSMDKDIVISCAGGGRIQRTNGQGGKNLTKLSSDIDLPSSDSIRTLDTSSNNNTALSSSSSSSISSSESSTNVTDDTILIYGYSVGYGRADHKLTATLLQQEFPMTKVTYSNDGY